VLLAIGKKCIPIEKYGDVGLSWGVKGELLIIDEKTNSQYEWTLGKDLDWHIKHKPETITFLKKILL